MGWGLWQNAHRGKPLVCLSEAGTGPHLKPRSHCRSPRRNRRRWRRRSTRRPGQCHSARSRSAPMVRWCQAHSPSPRGTTALSPARPRPWHSWAQKTTRLVAAGLRVLTSPQHSPRLTHLGSSYAQPPSSAMESASEVSLGLCHLTHGLSIFCWQW